MQLLILTLLLLVPTLGLWYTLDTTSFIACYTLVICLFLIGFCIGVLGSGL